MTAEQVERRDGDEHNCQPQAVQTKQSLQEALRAKGKTLHINQLLGVPKVENAIANNTLLQALGSRQG